MNRAIKRAVPLIVAALTCAAALGGCGGAAGVGPAELAQMRTEIAAARTAAASGDPTGVQSALGSLRRAVTQLRRRSALTDARAKALLLEIDQAQARVATDVPTAAAVTGATTPPASAPPALGPSGPASPGDGSPEGPDGAVRQDNGQGGDQGKQHGGDGGD